MTYRLQKKESGRVSISYVGKIERIEREIEKLRNVSISYKGKIDEL